MTTHQTSVCCLNVLCYVPARQPKIKRWVAKAGRPAAGQPVARGWRETLGPARPPHCETRSHQPGKKVSGGLQVAGPGRAEGLGPGVGPAVGPPDLALNLTDLLDCSCYAENCHCKVWNCLRPTFVWRASFTLGILASLSSSSLFIIP